MGIVLEQYSTELCWEGSRKLKKNQALENLVIHFCGKKSTFSKLLIILCENFTLAIEY